MKIPFRIMKTPKTPSILMLIFLLTTSFLPIFPIVAKVHAWFVLPMSAFVVIHAFSSETETKRALMGIFGCIYVLVAVFAICGFAENHMLGVLCLIFAATLLLLKVETAHPIIAIATIIIVLWSLSDNIAVIRGVRMRYLNGNINYAAYTRGLLDAVGCLSAVASGGILVFLICKQQKRNAQRYLSNPPTDSADEAPVVATTIEIKEEFDVEGDFHAPAEFSLSTADATNVNPSSKECTRKRKLWWLIVPVLACVLGIVVFVFANGSKTAATAAESVLYLEAYDSTGVCIGSGSGFLINDEVTLVTNYHVIDDAYALVAITSDSKVSVEVDSILTYDKTVDLAILKCKESIGVSPLVIANSDLVKQGDKIYAAGYPLGLAHTLSDGIVSSKYPIGKVDILQITAPISNGSSGGALLNEHGDVVGVIRSFYTDAQNMNLAIASNEITELLAKDTTPQSLEEFYCDAHPQVKSDNYYACIRNIILPTETMVNHFYEEWLDAGGTEDVLITLMDEYANKDELISLTGEYTVDVGNGDLLFMSSTAWKANGDLLSWIFDRHRRVGDINTFEVAWGHLVVYFSDAIKVGNYIETVGGDTTRYFLKQGMIDAYEDGYITREEYEQDLKRRMSADTKEEYFNDFEYYRLQHKINSAKVTEYKVQIRTIGVMTETEAQNIYQEWLAGPANEATMTAIMEKYGSEQSAGTLHTYGLGEVVDEVEDWCFDSTRSPGDVSIIACDGCFILCYFSGIVEKASAFETLSNWVNSNHNTTVKYNGTDNKAYSEVFSQDGDELTQQIVSCSTEGMICLRNIWSQSDGKQAITELWLTAQGNIFSCDFYCYADEKAQKAIFEGHGVIFAPSFYQNCPFEFDTTSGDKAKLEDYQSFAQGLYYSSVAYAEHILLNAAPEGCFSSMSDFEFYL